LKVIARSESYLVFTATFLLDLRIRYFVCPIGIVLSRYCHIWSVFCFYYYWNFEGVLAYANKVFS